MLGPLRAYGAAPVTCWGPPRVAGSAAGCWVGVEVLRGHPEPVVPALPITMTANLVGELGDIAAVPGGVDVQVSKAKRVDPRHRLLVGDREDVQPEFIQGDLNVLEVPTKALLDYPGGDPLGPRLQGG